MTDKPPIDEQFEDFEIGGELHEALDAGVRKLLGEAFAAFKSEGRWGINIGRVDETGVAWHVDWDRTRSDDNSLWDDEFPVNLIISPDDFVTAFKKDMNYYSEYELRQFLNAWRLALDKAEAAFKTWESEL